MDEGQFLRPEILTGLFENGLMGVEAPIEYGGAGSNFTAACIVIEELAKVDPAISVICDVQNTLLMTSLRKYGTEAQKTKHLTSLATNTLGCPLAQSS